MLPKTNDEAMNSTRFANKISIKMDLKPTVKGIYST